MPAIPVISSFDEVIRDMLAIVGGCLLNNSPEESNFGGVAKAGVGGRLTVGIYGTRKPGESGVVQSNNTLAMADIDPWLQSTSEN